LRRLKRKNPSIMILFSQNIMNSRNIILCFKYISRQYQWRKKIQTYSGMQFKTLSKKILKKSTKSMKGIDAPPNSLMNSIVSPKGENNERIRSWGTLLGLQHFGGRRSR
jgi:hypothetical protein